MILNVQSIQPTTTGVRIASDPCLTLCPATHHTGRATSLGQEPRAIAVRGSSSTWRIRLQGSSARRYDHRKRDPRPETAGAREEAVLSPPVRGSNERAVVNVLSVSRS